MPETVGDRVRVHRERLNWSQRELARRSGLGYQAINDIEHNRKTPRLESRKALADALEIELDELLTDMAGEPAAKEVAS